MEEKKKEEKIGEALLKVALGYQVAEVTEEYAEVDGKLKLTKRKKTKKDVPPDLKAVQLLLSSGESADYGEWSDEALEAEKQKLLAQLQERMATEERTGTTVAAEMAGEGLENSAQAEGAERSVTEGIPEGEKKPKRTVKKSVAKKSTKKSAGKKVTKKAADKGSVAE